MVKEQEKIYNWKSRGMKNPPAVGRTLRTSFSTTSPPAMVYEDWTVTAITDDGTVWGYRENTAVEMFSLKDME